MPPSLQLYSRQFSLFRYKPYIAFAGIAITIIFVISLGTRDSTVSFENNNLGIQITGLEQEHKESASKEIEENQIDDDSSATTSVLSFAERTGSFPPLLPETKEDETSTKPEFDDSGEDDDTFLVDTLNKNKESFDIAKALQDINEEEFESTKRIEEIAMSIIDSNNSTIIFDNLNSTEVSTTINVEKTSEEVQQEDIEETTIPSRMNLLPIKPEELENSSESVKQIRKEKRRLERLERLRRMNQSPIMI